MQSNFNSINIATRSQPVKVDNPEFSLKYIESSAFLSEKYKINENSVKKVITIVERIFEIYQVFGFIDFPKDNSQFLMLNKFMNKIEKFNMRRACRMYYKSVHRYCKVLATIGEENWAKLFKWKFCAFFSYHMGQEIPICKFARNDSKDLRQVFKPWFLLGGIVHDFHNYMESHMPEQFFEFLTSILHLKKGCPRMDVELVEAQIKATVEKLTTEPPEPSFSLGLDLSLEPNFDKASDPGFEKNVGCDLLKLALEKESVIADLVRTVDEIFGGKRLPWTALLEPFFPSCSAHYINSRSEGGAAGVLFTDPDNSKFLSKDEDLLSIGLENVRCFDPKSWHYGRYGKYEDEVLKNQGASSDLHADVPSLVIDDSDLRSRWTEFYWAQWNKAKAEIPLVAPVGLVEPLKVRVITKGPAYLYTVLKPIQKFLWRTLKGFRTFELISRYVSEDDINFVDNFNGLFTDPGKHYQWIHQWMLLSGDFEASTDNLYSFISNTISDRIIFNLFQNRTDEDDVNLPAHFWNELRSFMRTALTEHIFNLDGEDIPQKNGQLMGSIVSFPILCIANAAMCRKAQEIDRCYYDDVFGYTEGSLYIPSYQLNLEPTFRRIDGGTVEHHAPLLINGDDCLLRGTPFLKKIWEELAKAYGFTASMGKTYWSDSFCTINSSTFRKSLIETGDSTPGMPYEWKEVKYINSGLLHGLKRSSVGNTDPQQAHGNLGVIARELKRVTPQELWPKVKSLFISHNRKKLNAFSNMALPWFIPEWLGGVGLPRDNELISDEDRANCTIIRSCFADLIQAEKTDVEWKVNSLVLHQFKLWEKVGLIRTNYQKLMTDDELVQEVEQNYLEVYKLMCINLLFSRPFEELKNSEKRDGFIERNGTSFKRRRANPNGLRFLKQNSVLWSKARKIVAERCKTGTLMIDLMYDDEFEHEKRKFFFPCLKKELRVAVPKPQGALSAGWR